ncbi:Coatomer subunit gamma-2 [Hibiscus syriacus]|uniref:Coatomer subunit gamma-2 n=1 Tax=Hibiscus syriacus TaxID=106335 RepID=A0A6A2XYA5_HIBSY|nr:Coatomer subunit gamma-2 [Hibiscus syriacus]
MRGGAARWKLLDGGGCSGKNLVSTPPPSTPPPTHHTPPPKSTAPIASPTVPSPPKHSPPPPKLQSSQGTSNSDDGSKSNNLSSQLPVIVGLTIGVVLLLVIVMTLVIVHRHWGGAAGHGGWQQTPSPQGHTSYSSEMTSNVTGQPVAPPTHASPLPLGLNQSSFSYEELSMATFGFSQGQLLGQGGFGYVHKGERRMLVYEFLPNKTLEYHLHEKGPMDWPTRLKIALGAAKGLAYLHEDCKPPTDHSSRHQICQHLDYTFEAKVADFGLVRLTQDNNTHVSTRVIGTFGYLAPEYASSGKLTEKSDVFSFGVVLLELVTGRRPLDLNSNMDESLVDWARHLCETAMDTGTWRIGGPAPRNNFVQQEMARMVACAGASIRHSARRRPKCDRSPRFKVSFSYDQPLVKKDDDRDDEVDYSPFMGIEKGAVLQEARVFNDPQLDPRRCSQVITKLLYLLNQGETFTKLTSFALVSTVGGSYRSFLCCDKLFQSKDIGLRRMVYVMIKELSPSADETNPEIVKRWSNEVQEAVQSRAALVQFHALALLTNCSSQLSCLDQYLWIDLQHVIRQNDRLAVNKLVSSLSKGSVRSPLAQCLLIRYTSQAEMVIFEAARAITELNGVTSRELTPAITVLQLFLSSSKPVLRFAAIRTLNKVAMTHPMAVTNCNIDMESLMSDQNRSIATLAITTLLKTGNESSDEFLKHILREEGGFEYKKAIVDSIVILIRYPGSKREWLLHLCEFIEDCEFTYLSSQILHFLGIEGPKTSDPSKYIRYIYNRVLENATVRAAAVSTLAKFGAMVDTLKPRIFVLLRRCLFDNDDEVRDRATLYLNTLGGDGAVVQTDEISLSHKKAPGKKPTGLGAPPVAPPSTVDAYEKLLSSIPEFANFGKLFKSSAPVELTEAETEYAVNVVKHIFDGHVVFQYNCTNTIPEQLLENITVIVDASEAEEFAEVVSKPLRSLPYDSPGQTFVAFEKPEGIPAVGKFSNMLRFIVKEVDPSTGEAEDDGVEDEYQLEELEVVAADYMLKVGVSNFRNAWESMGADCERVDDMALGTEVVPNNSRSHTCLLSGVYIGNVKVLVRLQFGLDGPKDVAMKLAVRSEDEAVSDAIHEIVASG